MPDNQEDQNKSIISESSPPDQQPEKGKERKGDSLVQAKLDEPTDNTHVVHGDSTTTTQHKRSLAQ